MSNVTDDLSLKLYRVHVCVMTFGTVGKHAYTSRPQTRGANASDMSNTYHNTEMCDFLNIMNSEHYKSLFCSHNKPLKFFLQCP